MELKDEQKITASREAVYAALNDPEILKRCIPGCESLEKTSDTEMAATLALKIGPVKVKMKGSVELSNLNPPESYTITGEGKGGPSGFAKGGADITLVQEDDGTLLKYNVKVDIGGKIAQLGTRLIDSTAKKLSGQFFDKFDELVSTSQTTEEIISSEAIMPPTKDEEKTSTNLIANKFWLFLGAAIVALTGYVLAVK